MILSDLMKSAGMTGHALEKDPDIASIHHRSQDVAPGGLFVAVPGFLADGHDYIEDAARRGASVAVVQKSALEQKKIVRPEGVLFLETDDSRKSLAWLAAAFYGHPSKKLTVIGITGTNGKTTTSFIMESVLREAGLNAGVIGTINARHMGRVLESATTTPESADLQRIMADMVHDGVTHLILEVSSHSIDLQRIAGCHFDVGVFTNLTQDHLDYHKTMDDYRTAKKRFFTRFMEQSEKKRPVAVINRERGTGRDFFDELTRDKNSKIRCLSVGFADENMVRAINAQIDLRGVSAGIEASGGFFSGKGPLWNGVKPENPNKQVFHFQSRLPGRHNLENILCAAGGAMALGLSAEAIKKGIERCESAPGRLERVENRRGLFIYVDYAHTPDALENVCRAVRRLGEGRLICLFGCGGDRDAKKRPMMGRIAGKWSDLVIVTSDNPRNEDPEQIIQEILAGVKLSLPHAYSLPPSRDDFRKKGHVAEPDRETAIRAAIRAARPGDQILIAGKGHENHQLIKGEKIPFDDRIKVVEALEEADVDDSTHA